MGSVSKTRGRFVTRERRDEKRATVSAAAAAAAAHFLRRVVESRMMEDRRPSFITLYIGKIVDSNF